MTEPYITPRARADLFDIWNYIAQESLSAADRVVAELEAAMQRLAEFPRLGHRRDDVPDLQYRFWPVYSYLIVYTPDKSPIHILRVIHGNRDVPAALK